MLHRLRLPDVAVRYLAWLCLFLILWPGFIVAASPPQSGAVPVVTKLSGAVSVRGRDGVSNEIISSRIIHSGDVLMTGIDSRAIINLADVGGVRIGPTSTVTASVANNSLSVNVSAGSACAQALGHGVNIVAGPLTLSPAEDSSIFSLIRTPDATTVAVYQGSVTARTSANAAKPLVFKAGEAAVSSGGNPQQVSLASVQPAFNALQCPDPDIVQSVLPSPPPTQANGGGHGGGAGGLLAALLGLGAIAAAVGHGGGGGGGGSTQPTITPTAPPGSLQVSTNSISFPVGASPMPFTASEANYAGAINAVSSDPNVATVSPASGNGPSVQFTVTPVDLGGQTTTATITVTDDRGGSQIVNVSLAQPIVAAPTSFTFTDVGAGAAQPLNISENGYSGSFTIDPSACAGVATVNPTTSSGAFTVTPVGVGGPCNLTVTDNQSSTPVHVSVTVGPFGPVSPNPSSINLSTGGSSGGFSVTQTNYTGGYTIDPGSCQSSGAASVSPLSGNQSTTFTVSPLAEGNCKIVVTDDAGDTANVDVFVTSGSISVNPNTLQFPSGSAGQTQTFVYSDPSCVFLDTVTATPDGTVAASVSPSGPQFCAAGITYTVTAGSDGQGSVVVQDTAGGVATVSVGVGVSPLGKKHKGVGSHKPVPVPSRSPVAGGFGPIVPPARPQTPRTPLPASTPAPGPGPGAIGALHVSVTALSFIQNGPAQRVTISEPGYQRSFRVVSANPSVAAADQQIALGPLVTLAIVPRAVGVTTIQISDDHGGMQLIQVVVRGFSPKGARQQ